MTDEINHAIAARIMFALFIGNSRGLIANYQPAYKAIDYINGTMTVLKR